MDRTVKIFKPSGHKLAEITFSYDRGQQAQARITEFGQLYDDDDPDDESKSVYELLSRESYVKYQQFDSIDKIKAFDREYARRELRTSLDKPIDQYTFVYDADPVLLRYVLSRHHQGEVIGMVNVRFSFINNTKELAFLSGQHPRFDTELSANSLETNYSCMERMMLYEDSIVSACDVTRLDPWY
ncbi:hypothetical protein [Hymenobacter ruricola]|uniref:Uncharacterized protein n=1 Tax=Hymenobacter ruricola TaxID=2791023 RepID=A0ABS0I4G8_9BACT|nr:hypothetical protein [Hymenobacter ruricola]MBF9221444.1 hypothetical protein [Hymenobacter ruricola]